MKAMNKIKYAIFALAALVLGACAREEFNPNEDLNLARCLQPMNLNARVSAALGDVVTFSWDVTKDAEVYILTVQNSDGSTFLSEEVAPGSVPYQKKLEADKTFTFNVQAKAAGKGDSKVADFGKTFKTFAVKDNLFMKVTAREATSVSFAWSKEVADFQEVTKIEYYPSKYGETAGSGAGSHTLSAEEIAAASATVDGLTPATEYTFTLYYLSASRGQVDAWTTPDVTGFTEVNSLAALQNAVKTEDAKVLLKMEGSPYDMEMLDIAAGFTLVGEESVDGTKPVLQGELHIADAWAGSDLYFESVQFDGAPTALSPSGFGFPLQNKNGGAVDGKNIGNITFKNCVITNYSKGLIYEWGKAMVLGDVTYDSCDITKINADGSGGGDVFDIRQATTIKTLAFVNNTIAQGMRTFLRIDAGSIGKLQVENNTFWNLNFVDNANNAGLFGLQIVPGETSFKNNLVLHMVEKATFGSANAKYKTASDVSLTASNNWYYNLVETYFTETWTAAAGGFTALDADPCYNAAGGYFNLNQDSPVAGKGVGASKWWTPYVEEPEDLTQKVLTEAHTWDLTNARLFAGTIKKQMVRDELLIVASESNPVVVEDGTLSFQNAAVTNRYGVPTDGYVAFKVDAPGSVVARAEGAGSGHFVVAIQPVEGGDLIVKGGIVPVADAPATQKIVISDITEASWVYVYPSGAVTLAQLAWSKDVSAVNTALPAPDPKANPSSFTAGESTDVTVSWDAVENAGGYSVVFSGKTYAAEGLSFTIEGKTTSMLDAGSYEVLVYANPSATDIYNTQSEAGKAAFAVLPAGGGESSEFIVSSVEDLMSAIDAGKDFITLKYSELPYEISSVTLVAPLHLKGQVVDGKLTPVNASFTLSGEIGGSVVLSNLAITSVKDGAAVSVLIDDKTNAPVADTVAIYDSRLHGTKALYDNSGKAASNVQYVIFKGNLIEDSSNGADFIDMRAGAHHNFVFENNTVANSCRTFVRTDAGHEMNTALIKNNTFYKVATNSTSKDNNGILHIRSAAGSGLYDYRVENNFFYSILFTEAPGHANGFPKFKSGGGLVPNTIRNNYFFDCEDREEWAAYSFWKNLSKEDATAQGGAILPADPCKNAEDGDFTLTNAVMMNAGVGDPRWNSMAGSTPTSEITVNDSDALLTALSAGKKVITLSDGSYASEAAIVLNAPVTLKGSSAAVLNAKFELGEGATSLRLEGISLDGADALDNMIYVKEGVKVNVIALSGVNVKAYKNRMVYQDKESSGVGSLVIENALVSGMGTSGDFIDFRKGDLTAMKVVNSTFANGIRTFARIDAAVVCGSILVQNNTFYNLCFVDSKDNNGIFHVRSSSVTSAGQVIVKDNLFASMHRAAETPSNAQGFPKLVSKASSAIALPVFSHNYFADVLSTENNTDAEYSWWAYSPKESALAGYGVELTADVFKDAANGDFTVVHGLVASEGVGDPRWIKGAAAPADPYPVATTADLLTAIEAGKSNIVLTGSSYDLTATEAGATGSITVVTSFSLKGKSTNGIKPQVIGGFKLALAEGGDFNLEGLRLSGAYTADGAEKTVSKAVEIDATSKMGVLTLKNCDFSAYGPTLVSNAGESTVEALEISGITASGFAMTGGDFIDFRKGNIGHIKVVSSTFSNGIRTFLRVDANAVLGGATVQNNTFYNLCSIDNKDNNGIMHVRSSNGVSPASLATSARRILVTRNIFASMHKAAEGAPSAANGFPKLVSTASEKIKHPYITDNLFFDIDTAEGYSWWNTMTAEDIEEAGKVLDETPFSADPATGKFTVKSAYKGYGDSRW